MREKALTDRQIERHAYLIICHDNFAQLRILLELLGYPDNDIYIHVDKKAKTVSYDFLISAIICSNVYFTERIKVNWGGFSQVKAELILLETAIRKEHYYYHLISDADLPLHTQNDIHEYFQRNSGLEYLRAENISQEGNTFLEYRFKRYRFFQEKNRSNGNL